MALAAPAQRRSDFVTLLVFAGQGLRLGVRNGVHRRREFAHAVAVGRKAELHFGGDLVALGDRHLAHVVAEAAEFRTLPVAPGARRPHPGGDPVVDFRVGPMADDDLAGEPHARMDEARLAVAVRRLVQVHEIHVDRLPRQISIELGVEMHERLLKRVQPADPHFRRRKRMHPEDQAGAVLVGIRLHAELGDLVGRGQKRLETVFSGSFGESASAPAMSRASAATRCKGPGPVEMLRAADEPDFGSGEIDHERPCENFRFSAALVVGAGRVRDCESLCIALTRAERI